MIRFAFKKGYRVREDGSVISHKGKVRKLMMIGRDYKRYPTFTVTIPDSNNSQYPVPVHKLVAYQKFGEAALMDGVHARHLDDDATNNSWDNIAIGSMSDNMKDRSCYPITAYSGTANLRMNPETLSAIKKDKASGMGNTAIAKKHKFSASTIYKYLR